MFGLRNEVRQETAARLFLPGGSVARRGGAVEVLEGAKGL
jgi:hypothetical protein